MDATAIAARRPLTPELRERLVHEIVAYTDPWYFAGRDAAIPAHRHDLMRTYAAWRIARSDATHRERDDLARALAPVPDHTFNGSAPNFGPTYQEALAAHRRRHARKEGTIAHAA